MGEGRLPVSPHRVPTGREERRKEVACPTPSSQLKRWASTGASLRDAKKGKKEVVRPTPSSLKRWAGTGASLRDAKKDKEEIAPDPATQR